MGLPVYVTWSFPFAAFNSLSVFCTLSVLIVVMGNFFYGPFGVLYASCNISSSTQSSLVVTLGAICQGLALTKKNLLSGQGCGIFRNISKEYGEA